MIQTEMQILTVQYVQVSAVFLFSRAIISTNAMRLLERTYTNTHRSLKPLLTLSTNLLITELLSRVQSEAACPLAAITSSKYLQEVFKRVKGNYQTLMDGSYGHFTPLVACATDSEVEGMWSTLT